MMKRFLMILAMLLWCSTGFAENINWNDMKKLHQKKELKVGIKGHGNIVLSSKNKEFKNSDLAKKFLNYVDSYLDKREECYEWGDLTVLERLELKIEDPLAIKVVQCLQSYDRILIQSYGLTQLGSMAQARSSLLQNLPKDRSQTITLDITVEEMLIQINTFQEMERLVESTYLRSGKKPKPVGKRLSKEEVNKLKAEIKENGVIPYERDIVADESEYALLIQEQHEFVKTEKAIILNDINKSKKICIDMGFSETTFLIFKNEKFNQCVLTIWKTELMGKKYVKMQKELNSQLAEIEQKQIELNDVASALNST